MKRGTLQGLHLHADTPAVHVSACPLAMPMHCHDAARMRTMQNRLSKGYSSLASDAHVGSMACHGLPLAADSAQQLPKQLHRSDVCRTPKGMQFNQENSVVSMASVLGQYLGYCTGKTISSSTAQLAKNEGEFLVVGEEGTSNHKITG